MRNFIKLSILLISIFAYIQSNAQSVKPTMTFDTEVHNFGKIKETGGSVSFKYIFTNTGSEALVITNVRSSCGCTTPDWSKNPIPPGGKGFVSASYNPLHRPGKFHKTVTVTSNAENSPIVLKVNGEVTKPELTVNKEYRYNMDGVRLKTQNLHFGSLYKEYVEPGSSKKVKPSAKEPNTKMIEIINTNDYDVNLTFNKNRTIPVHLNIYMEPKTLKPNQKGQIYISYDPVKKRDWGYVYDRITVTVNDKINNRNRITVSATLSEKFTEKQIKNPPVMTFTGGKEFEFGTINQGDKVEHIFKFKNTGKSDLIIRKTKASCGCTAIAPKDKIIKAGQESEIKAIFNSRGKRGRQSKSITITTNIPGKAKNGQNNSSVVLKMLGHVNVPEKPKKTQQKNKTH